MFVMNTVFNMAETSLVASVIQFYHSQEETKLEQEDSGLRYRGQFLSYSDIFKVGNINGQWSMVNIIFRISEQPLMIST